MKILLSAICIVYLFSSFTHGVTHSKLTCRSASGRTLFTANFEDYGSLEDGTLSIDNVEMLFSPEDNCHVIFDPDAKVYTLYIESDAHSNFDTLRYIELWAIPTSFKDTSSPDYQFDEVYKFKAKMRARDPRNRREDAPLIQLDCVFRHWGP